MSRNVVLFILDSVRKDFFDEYAPRLQQLADVSFDHCYAASSWSAPSHASMMTGRLPHQHGVHAHNRRIGSIPREETFLSRLEDYRHVGVSANVFAGEAFGFDRLFNEFSAINRFGVLPGGVNPDTFHQEHPEGVGRFCTFIKEAYDRGELVASVANGGLVKVNDFLDRFSLRRFGDYGLGLICREATRLTEREPYFLFANFMEAHGPHQPTRAFDASLFDVPSDWSSHERSAWDINTAASLNEFDEYLRRYRELYAASIDYVDRKLVEYITELCDRSEHETTVVITADHGEELAFPEDGGRLGHAAGFSSGLLHVPCLVVNAPTDPSIDGLVSHLDLGDLLVGLSDDTFPDVSRDQVPAERIGLGEEIELDDQSFWDRSIRCVYDRRHRYEWDSLGQQRVYRLHGASREEAIDAEFDPSVFETEHFDCPIEQYKQKAEKTAEVVDIDTATANRLKDLGYL